MFLAPEFDQWAFHHHAEKLADRRVWASYKLPLKRYIRDYDGDDEYYARKTKVSSSTMQCGRQVAITADLEPIAFGVHSISRRRMREKYGAGGLDALLTDAARARKHARERGYISIEGAAADEGKSERAV